MLLTGNVSKLRDSWKLQQMRHWKIPGTSCQNQIQKYQIQMDLVAFHLHSYLHMHILYISLNYIYITCTFARQFFGVFTPVNTLPNSKSCPHLRLHTYSEKPEHLTNCLCLKTFLKILQKSFQTTVILLVVHTSIDMFPERLARFMPFQPVDGSEHYLFSFYA